jgi:hypothetical protein
MVRYQSYLFEIIEGSYRLQATSSKLMSSKQPGVSSLKQKSHIKGACSSGG